MIAAVFFFVPDPLAPDYRVEEVPAWKPGFLA